MEELAGKEKQAGVGRLHLAHEVNQHLCGGRTPTQAVARGGPLQGGWVGGCGERAERF